jgi:ABC-type nitrate/sulfonate/bicarbonate transport system substrate-binding protein
MQIQVTRGRILTLGIMVALVAGACSGGGATPTTGTSGGPSTAPASGGSGAPASAGPSFGAPEKASLKIGLSTSGETSQFAENLASQLDLYKKFGLTVEVSGFEGDGKVVQAVTAGALDFGVVGVSSAISSVPTDTPLKVLAMNGVTLTDGLVCGPSFKSANDIKGKQVAVSTFGGTSHGSVLIMLSQLGLTANDVVITQVGAQDARLAAVKAGSVACAPIDLAKADAVKAAGLNTLTDNKSSGKQWGRSGLATTAAFAQANPNTVKAVVAAVLSAQNSMWIDPATAATKFAEYAQVDAAEATKNIADFTAIGDRAMGWTDDAFNFPKQTLATVNPAMADVDVSQAYDKSILQGLFDSGFYTQINDPDKPF